MRLSAWPNAGFQKEGILRSFNEIDGQRIDCVIFSLLPSDIEPRYPAA
jgi:RimJ/RimL family protein N-acetyltransferase